MNDINKMLCQDKFGILLTFNDGDQQIEGIYDTYEEACKKLDFCMKVIKADFTEQCNVDLYISPRSGRYYYDGNYSKNTPRFPIESKVIDVCNDGWTRLHAEIHGIAEDNNKEVTIMCKECTPIKDNIDEVIKTWSEAFLEDYSEYYEHCTGCSSNFGKEEYY